jgi:hypothetical protein
MEIIETNYENKIQVGRNLVYVKDKIVHVITIGDNDEESALRMRSLAFEIQEKLGTLNALIDLNKAGKSTPEARKVWKELSELGDVKVAFVGLHPVARVLASFTMVVSGNKNTKFFSTQEEAIGWLKLK